MEMDPPLPLHADRRRRCREYLLALEEERRKIQVFQRELPLCLDLVTQTIEGMRSHMDDDVGCEETVTDHGPVLEEFMPLKPSLSLSSSEEREGARDDATATDADGGVGKKAGAETQDDGRLPPPEANKAMSDWLQSVQLWTQKPQQHPDNNNKELPCKPVALNVSKARGGAFHPFEKAKRAELPASSTTAAASSAVVGDNCDMAAATDTAGKHSGDKDMSKSKHANDKGKGSKDKEGQSESEEPNRKPRRCWAPELHRRFLQALQQLGGSHVATPKQIRELMKVEGLTNDEVKSHLQKYRLHTRRPNSTTVQSRSTSAAPPVPQFVVVGGIWVPPPEYAAVAAAAAAQPQVHIPGDASGTANNGYAPAAVVTLQSGLQQNSQQGQRQLSRCSEGRGSGDASSGSPAVSSSSSQTTSA